MLFSIRLLSLFATRKKSQGNKVTIGDNLSYHFKEDVLRLYQENNIAIVCLLLNLTHVLQPLDAVLERAVDKDWPFNIVQLFFLFSKTNHSTFS